LDRKEKLGNGVVIEFPSPGEVGVPADAPDTLPSWDLTICQIKVTLKYVNPPIWRRILVHQETKLPKFHRILQCVMGWRNYHLHESHIGPIKFGEPVPDEHYNVLSERNVRLSHLERGDEVTFEYHYDFGDQWEHAVVIERMLAEEDEAQYPFCLEGARACPPEDCGMFRGLFRPFRACLITRARSRGVAPGYYITPFGAARKLRSNRLVDRLLFDDLN